MKASFVRIHSAALVVVAAFVMASSQAVADEPAGAVIDSPYEAVEARSIELTFNGDGDIVQIRAKGCQECPSATVLPSRELIVESGSETLKGSEKKVFNGMPGVIHIYRPSGMAHRISFVKLVGEGEDSQ